jgi:branched-chain amino acid transport system permease protein
MDQDYYYTLLNFIGIHALLVVGLNLLLGYAGQISLGHAAFFGLGAYTSGILTATAGVNPWLALPAGLAVAGAAAFLIGIPALKLRGYYLAMATLGFGIIMYIILNRSRGLDRRPLGAQRHSRRCPWPASLQHPRRLFLLIWPVLGVILCYQRQPGGLPHRPGHPGLARQRSRGRVSRGGHLPPECSFLSGAPSTPPWPALYAHTLNFIAPSSFGFMFSIKLVTMVVLGGMASIWGSLLGAGRSPCCRNFSRCSTIRNGHLRGILMVVMIFLPRGLVRGILDVWELRRYRKEGGNSSDS